jgi:hypothetical protein
MKRCAQCRGKLGLGVRSRNVWNGRWWVHVLYCSTHCEALYELERQRPRQTWLARIHTWQQSAELTEGDPAIALFRFPIFAYGKRWSAR